MRLSSMYLMFKISNCQASPRQHSPVQFWVFRQMYWHYKNTVIDFIVIIWNYTNIKRNIRDKPCYLLNLLFKCLSIRPCLKKTENKTRSQWTAFKKKYRHVYFWVQITWHDFTKIHSNILLNKSHGGKLK